MSRNQLRLDLEDIGYRHSVIQSSPVLAVLTSPDFLKEVNFHQRIATFGKIPSMNGWTDNDIHRRSDFIGSPEMSISYISNNGFADPFVSSSADYDLPTEIDDIGKLIKPEPSPEPFSDREVTDKDSEEKWKLERRRLKNREAAHRCRRKKMEKIAHLEGQVRALQAENSRIVDNIKRLEEEAAYLRTICQQKKRGCPHCLAMMDI